ncbi:diguanylate cyclase domain-containing protein [Pseudomonas schmalbachii]|uniref:Diguanylate cyclase n=1 Tax=Pseudomonas schmalbachii TaxID=2816993 RepID=A0ABS3TT66_9PSED|nr:diguanylate cyclase [Pseudomonas schmalbachii]MBO3276866.1 diguanylate cyclase [Pseudomonas schmalbachii]
MNLRKRLFCLALPLLLLTLLVIGAMSQAILLTRFDANDRQQLRGEANSIAVQLDNMITRSQNVLRASAWSNRLYMDIQYQSDPRSRYEFLDIDTVRNQDFHFELIFDNQGRAHATQWVPPDLDNLLPGPRQPTMEDLQRGVLEHIRKIGLVVGRRDSSGATAQMVLIEGVPTVLLSSPISNDNGTATPVGVMVAGRFLGTQRLNLLRHLISGDLQFLPVQTDAAQHWLPISSREFLHSVDIKIGPPHATAQQQHVDLQFSNHRHEPELLIRIVQPREFYENGKRAIWLFVGLASVAALFSLLLVYIGLERWVLLRVRRLNREVASIDPHDVRPILSITGDDEISQMTRGLNRMLEQLSRSELRGQAVLDSIKESYFEIDTEGRIVHVNRALQRLTGFTQEQLVGRPYNELLTQVKDQLAIDEVLQRLRVKPLENFRLRVKGRDGALRWLEASCSAAQDSSGAVIGIRGFLRDISDQVVYQNQLLDLAYRDPLTGLGNRKAFDENLEQQLAGAATSAETTALLFLDLDHFKDANDRHGHDLGDQLLRTVAERLRSNLRGPDKCFRLGGDEFTVILQQSDEQSAMALGERLRRALCAPYQFDGICIDFISPSIGVALHPRHATAAEALVKAADSAMYMAKRRRNCCCLYDEDAAPATATGASAG